MTVCSLEQLAEAYDKGFRSQKFGQTKTKGIVANLDVCTFSVEVKCFVEDTGEKNTFNEASSLPGGVIAYTDKRRPKVNVWCCGK